MEKENDVAVYQRKQASADLDSIDIRKYALDEDSLSRILAAARLGKVETLMVASRQQICKDPIRCEQIVQELKANGVDLVISDEERMYEQIDNMLKYMDNLNHRTEEELQDEDLSVSIRVAGETVEMPLIADVYNAIYYMLKELKE